MRPTPTTHHTPGHTAITPVTPDDSTSAGPEPAGLPDAGQEHAPGRGRATARAADTAPTSAPSGRVLAKATLLTSVLSMAGALLGLVRDQSLAHFFGASGETDALLVAWTLPELAGSLLIEDGMVIALVPAFSVALARRAQGVTSPDPVRALIAASLPRLGLALAAMAAVFIAAAPPLVSVLAPGLPDPSLAVDCTRMTATCVLTFGLAGYCSAALRAHRSYLPPATISLASNTAIIVTMFVLGGHWGVRSAAFGVALGGCLMVAVQALSLWRRISDGPRKPASAEAGEERRPLALALVGAVLLFSLCRHSQVLVERYFGSALPSGSISHLNYAQKVGQFPMMLALMLAIVTYPVVAQAIAQGDLRRARERIERDLVLVASIALAGAAAIVVCAPQIVQLLFQRGAFTAADTASTAGILRVYTLGLLGHTLVGALMRSYFSAGRATWYPAGAMAVGMVATAGIDAWSADHWGARGIAAGNAAGITLTALILLHGLGSHGVPVRVRRLVGELAKPPVAAVCAAGAGFVCTRAFTSPPAAVAAGGVSVTAVFLLLAWVLDAADARALMRSASLTVRRSLTRKLRHGR
ncbi:murein biosynthesis integral membrane protein MurJ [Streptomyces cellostaticus]|uniref:murein biosynthesis integral membrane protein MurJ n=1 Tax=Streptomyces cellostaticus TaxID=67285 RepID=UPI00099E3748|nr:lipid II flippase MurJ [Streptomyces cellostaticus]GHI07621.1 membrane protein [Streptomyces cellostaticus]